MRPVRVANNSTVRVVWNVKVRLEAEQSILPLSLHHLLREIFFKYVNQIKIMTYRYKKLKKKNNKPKIGHSLQLGLLEVLYIGTISASSFLVSVQTIITNT